LLEASFLGNERTKYMANGDSPYGQRYPAELKGRVVFRDQ